MSEDDGVAIVTRRLIREHPLFKQRIKVMVIKNGKPRLATGNAMSPTDKQYLMAIESFRKCNKDLLPEPLVAEFAKEQKTPNFDSLEEAFTKISDRWNKMIKAVEPWSDLLEPGKTVEPYRTSNGGHVLVRPIGITAFVGAMSTAPDSMTIKHIRTVVSTFKDLTQAPWNGVLWNSSTRKMANSVEAEKLSRRLWRYLMGLPENKDTLTKDWRAMVEPGNPDTRIKLPAPMLAG